MHVVPLMLKIQEGSPCLQGMGGGGLTSQLQSPLKAVFQQLASQPLPRPSSNVPICLYLRIL